MGSICLALACRAVSPLATDSDEAKDCSIRLATLSDCKLSVGWYPSFSYDASGGGGTGSGQKLQDGRIKVRFPPDSVRIPALDFSTTRFVGLPLPPPLRIDIKPQLLQGFVDQQSGDVELKFVAEFIFSVGSLYTAPALFVDTLLTTDAQLKSGRAGKRMDEQGRCNLVGTAHLTKVDDAFLNSFLSLPSECLADLSAQLLIH